ncbi:MAG: GGGtGRT protein, partial [Kiritimatiellae bacterium]|nr:GGGtGRT protein [Kiritimatiellia bacterium]
MACAKKKCCAKKAAPKAAPAAEKLFEGYERREAKILAALKPYGIKSILECKEICDKAGVDAYKIVEETQPICFENAKWAYTVGAAMAIKKGCTKAKDAAAEIGVGLQAFCIPGSVAENR